MMMKVSINMKTLSLVGVAVISILCCGESYTVKCKNECTPISGSVSFNNSCSSCSKFVMCSQGLMQELTCPKGMLWDNIKKICATESQTCLKPKTTQKTLLACVKNCRGMQDGFYKSCKSCSMYVWCKANNTLNRPCPAGKLYDDRYRTCVTATTCPGLPKELTDKCVSTCSNKDDGTYQSCTDCHWYVVCEKQKMSTLPCPAGFRWDDTKKSCTPNAPCFMEF